MKIISAGAFVASAALLLSACGSSSPTTTTSTEQVVQSFDHPGLQVRDLHAKSRRDELPRSQGEQQRDPAEDRHPGGRSGHAGVQDSGEGVSGDPPDAIECRPRRGGRCRAGAHAGPARLRAVHARSRRERLPRSGPAGPAHDRDDHRGRRRPARSAGRHRRQGVHPRVARRYHARPTWRRPPAPAAEPPDPGTL